MGTYTTAQRMVREAPDMVLGMLIVNELGVTPTTIAKRGRFRRDTIIDILDTARIASAWGITKEKGHKL